MIGSRPPRCKGICLNCGPCEAVQVPATPQGDESSNYKPMNWKCKCGKFIFNP
ncbi:EPIDERMAL PATTERNING FACTOR-like protein 2 [Dendrobium catenatum]|uniref:Epidermal patterning factor-like protein n=1 Tax=Dendrobium catenatum TaxID=906689 RepID=A0A2I0XDU3_9ASPA|nr:EPIDERMAL PATTERNING FACTOR-like protein 2 [Dendrobium catenatum]